MLNKLKQYFDFKRQNLKMPVIFLVIFFGIGIWRYVATGWAFYIFNFGYIGTSIAIGFFLGGALKRQYADWGRRVTQLLIGCYILGFIGFTLGENMQLEGFFFYLLMGIFGGATLHYFVAKIAGPLLFGRGWCAGACWTAMILDLLPWKKYEEGRYRKLGILRYVHFSLVLGLVLFLWYRVGDIDYFRMQQVEIRWMIIGNIAYYIVGIGLAAMLKDNRAFCKYLCPITTFLKVGSRFSLMKVAIDQEKCIDCGLCEKACLMDIKLLAYKDEGQRVLSSECIQCQVCRNTCPKEAISLTFGLDCSMKEKLNWKD